MIKKINGKYVVLSETTGRRFGTYDTRAEAERPCEADPRALAPSRREVVEMNVRVRVQIAKGKLREYEGRLKQLEGRLTALRGRAEQTTGRARLRLVRAERRARTTTDASVERVEIAIKALQSRLETTLRETRALSRGVRTGVRTGAKTYRRLGRR